MRSSKKLPRESQIFNIYSVYDLHAIITHRQTTKFETVKAIALKKQKLARKTHRRMYYCSILKNYRIV